MHTFKYTSLILLSSSRQLTKYAAPPMHNKLCTTSFTFCNLSVCGLLRPCVQLHVCDCLLGLQRDLRGDTTITCSLTSETVCIRLPQGHWLLILWCRNKKLYSELLENLCWYRSYSSSTYFAFTCHVMTRYNQDISVQWSLSLYSFKQSSLSRGKWLDPLIQKTGNVLGDGSSFQTSSFHGPWATKHVRPAEEDILECKGHDKTQQFCISRITKTISTKRRGANLWKW